LGCSTLSYDLRRAAALGRPVEAAVAWHAVPTELGRTTARVALFEAAWERHVGPGRLVRSHEPEGQALLELLRHVWAEKSETETVMPDGAACGPEGC